MRAPVQTGNPATCFPHGQAFLAELSIGRDLAETGRIKIVCARAETLSAGIRPAAARRPYSAARAFAPNPG